MKSRVICRAQVVRAQGTSYFYASALVRLCAYALVLLICAAGCESKQAQTATPAQESKPKSHPITGVTFEGGDGSSVEKAIIIKAPNDFVGVRAEYGWIRAKIPNWQLVKQSAHKIKNRFYDKMDFRTPDGQSKTLYFDITDFYGKME